MKQIIKLISQKNTIDIITKNLLSIMLVFLMVTLIPPSAFAQTERVIQGTAVDSQGEPVFGATVYLKGTSIGTTTDIGGKFVLKVPSDEGQILVVSFIGMLTEEINIDNQNNVEVVLIEDLTQLESVIVVGYGRQTKKSIVGSITQTNSEVLERAGGINSLGAALTGNLPGVITTTSTGMPGAEDPKIVIRSRSSWNNSDPLILVDGIERPMSSVDINSVESVSVLKDASATAVYGVKGANGVILITTKRGKKGKASVQVKTNQTVKFLSKLPAKYDSYESLMLANKVRELELALEPKGWADYIPQEIIEKYRNPSNSEEWDRYPNTNWEEELFKDYALSNNTSVNVSGGTEKVTYFSSIDYLKEGDMFKEIENNRGYNSGYGFTRINVRSNLDFQLTKSTKFSTNLFGSNGARMVPWGSSDSDGSYWKAAYATAPDAMRARYSDGTWGWFAPRNYDQMNSVYVFATSGYEKRTQTAITTDFIIDQDLSKLTKGLSLKGGISIDNRFKEVDRGVNDLYNNAQRKWVDPSTGTTIYEQPINTSTQLDYSEGINWSTNGGEVETSSTFRKLYYYLQLYYERSFGKSNLTTMGLFSREKKASGGVFPRFREDWVFRITYNYAEKYFIETNGAYNGSEAFGPGYRFQYFPSLSGGWMISEENFIKNNLSHILTLLKIRGSWGRVGDDKIYWNEFDSDYRFLYIDEWEYGGNAELGDPASATPYTFYRNSKLGNPDISWETVEKQNIGVDFNFFNGFIAGAFDLFKDKRTDILIKGQDRAIPSYFGAEIPPPANIGEVESQGYEFELNFSKALGSDLRLWLKTNMTHATNKVIFADDPVLEPDYQKKQGYAISQTRSYIDLGFVTSWDDVYGSTERETSNAQKLPGDYNIIDFNGDGVINSDDQAPYGYSDIPQNTYSATFGVDWKGFGFSAQFYGVNNVTRQVEFPTFHSQSNIVYDEGTFYSVDGSGDIPLPRKLTTLGTDAQGTRYWYDGSYVRLKNIELSYSINSMWINKLGMSVCRLYVNGSNLWLWTKMPDDRESNFSTNGSTSSGAYPTVKRINFGLDITF